MSIHSAPSVVYPLGRSRFQACVLFSVWFAGLLLTVLWWSARPQLDWRLAVGFLALLVAAWSALLGYRRLPAGQLAWDGQEWRWESASYQTGTAGQKLSLIADFQRVLVLRLENHAGARLWLCAEKSAMPERWLDLRRAVHFCAPPADGTSFHADAALLEGAGATDVAVSTHAHHDALSKP